MTERKEYLGELARNWRVLLAASLGMAVGLSMFSYITSIFAPFLIKDFGWTRSTFALIGFTMLATLPTMPIAGRLTDRYGAKRMATLGVLLLPVVICLFAFLEGDFRTYFACSAGVLVVMVPPVSRGCYLLLTGPTVAWRAVPVNLRMHRLTNLLRFRPCPE